MSFLRFDGCYRRPWALFVGAAVLCGVSVLGLRDAAANAAGYEVYVVLTPVPAAELRQIRGGLRVAGLDIDFAAQVQVYVNNIKVATTQLVLKNLGGIDSTTEFPNPPPAGLSVSSFLQDGPVGLNKMQGFTIADAAGLRSFALHSIALSHTASAVINTINNMAVKQVVTETLSINNFAAIQSKLLNQATAHAAAMAGVPDAIMGIGN